ncbi:MAG: response regulator [Planctomycetaceae bacterium]|nr:response regulator [Planctomycetaceae bacterium]
MSGQVIVAEDNRVLQDVIRFNLTRAGYSVRTATEGRQVLQLISEAPADLLVTDCQMPGMSGLELVATIRSMADLKDLPILFCTAKGLEIDQRILDELRLPVLLCKPFSPRDLVEKCKQLLEASAVTTA